MPSTPSRPRDSGRGHRRPEHGYRRDLTGVLRDTAFWEDGDPAAQERVLTELSDDPFVGSRLAAVEHPKCPPAVLARRLDDEDVWVACAAALHPAVPSEAAARKIQTIPSEAQTQAARDYTRRSVPASPRLRADQVALLWALALNTRLPLAVSHEAIRVTYTHAPHMKSRTRDVVADLDRWAAQDGGNPGAPGSLGWGWWVIGCLATHPDAPIRAIAVRALFRPDPATGRPAFGYISWQDHLVDQADDQDLAAIATDTRDPAVLDRVLAREADVTVRRRVAKNPAVGIETITQLMTDPDLRVRRAATDRFAEALNPQ